METKALTEDEDRRKKWKGISTTGENELKDKPIQSGRSIND